VTLEDASFPLISPKKEGGWGLQKKKKGGGRQFLAFWESTCLPTPKRISLKQREGKGKNRGEVSVTLNHCPQLKKKAGFTSSLKGGGNAVPGTKPPDFGEKRRGGEKGE